LARVGIITGTDREADCLDIFPTAETPPMIWTGGDAARTETAVRDLIGQGCDAIASIGTAGGLQPGLKPGALVLPRRIRGGDEIYETDPGWRDALVGVAEAAEVTMADGDLAYSDIVLHGVAEKAALYEASGAVAVDMESLPAARVAAQLGMRFVAVRVVIDEADRALPRAVSAAMVEDGAIRIDKLLGALIMRPQEIPLLIGLGRASSRAFKTLRRVAARTGPGFGL
jgi:adenosylhomocysteine nucleosidase